MLTISMSDESRDSSAKTLNQNPYFMPSLNRIEEAIKLKSEQDDDLLESSAIDMKNFAATLAKFTSSNVLKFPPISSNLFHDNLPQALTTQLSGLLNLSDLKPELSQIEALPQKLQPNEELNGSTFRGSTHAPQEVHDLLAQFTPDKLGPSKIPYPPQNLTPKTLSQNTSSNKTDEDYCTLCQKHFCNKYYLRKHKADVHGIHSEPFSQARRRESNMLTQHANFTNRASNLSPHESGKQNSIEEILEKMKNPTELAKYLSGNQQNDSLPMDIINSNPLVNNMMLLPQIAAGMVNAMKFEEKTSQVSPPPMKKIKEDFFNIQQMIKYDQENVENEIKRFSSPSNIKDRNSPQTPPTSLDSFKESMAAAKLADRVVCDLCNKELCNKYFLRTHKIKVHGVPNTEMGSLLTPKPFQRSSQSSENKNLDELPINYLNMFTGEVAGPQGLATEATDDGAVCPICGINLGMKLFLPTHLYATHQINFTEPAFLMSMLKVNNPTLQDEALDTKDSNGEMVDETQNDIKIADTKSISPCTTDRSSHCEQEPAPKSPTSILTNFLNQSGLKNVPNPINFPSPNMVPNPGFIPPPLGLLAPVLGLNGSAPNLPPNTSIPNLGNPANWPKDFSILPPTSNPVGLLNNNPLFQRPPNTALQPTLSGIQIPFSIMGQQHSSNSKSPNQMRVLCDICNKWICNKYFLRTHKANKHGIHDGIIPNQPQKKLLGEKADVKTSPELKNSGDSLDDGLDTNGSIDFLNTSGQIKLDSPVKAWIEGKMGRKMEFDQRMGPLNLSLRPGHPIGFMLHNPEDDMLHTQSTSSPDLHHVERRAFRRKLRKSKNSKLRKRFLLATSSFKNRRLREWKDPGLKVVRKAKSMTRDALSLSKLQKFRLRRLKLVKKHRELKQLCRIAWKQAKCSKCGEVFENLHQLLTHCKATGHRQGKLRPRNKTHLASNAIQDVSNTVMATVRLPCPMCWAQGMSNEQVYNPEELVDHFCSFHGIMRPQTQPTLAQNGLPSVEEGS